MSIKYTIDEFGIVVKYGKFPISKIDVLRESIRKWKWLVKYLKENPDKPIPRSGNTTCALCEIFVGDACIDCPVYRRTKMESCKRTPYDKYCNAGRKNNHPLAEKYAQKEVEFLESLLPKKPQK